MRWLLVIVVLCSSVTLAGVSQAASINEDVTRREKLNQFVQSLYSFNTSRIKGLEVIVEESTGGYGGVTNNLEFYRAVRYFDKKTGNLLADIKWESDNPDNLHTIDLYIYDTQGRIEREYSAAYLPVYRKAPYVTLINIHHYSDGLHGYRQFDFADNRLFEFCTGEHLNQPVHIVLDEYEIPDSAAELPDAGQRAVYNACFGEIPTTVKSFLVPGV